MLPINAEYIRYLRSPEGKQALNPFPDKFAAGSNELAVYVFGLLSRVDNEYTCWPSLPRIASDCGASRETAKRTVSILESMGWIEVKRQRGTANRYRCIHYERWLNSQNQARPP